MAVDAVPRTGKRIETELTKRYGDDYEIACPELRNKPWKFWRDSNTTDARSP